MSEGDVRSRAIRVVVSDDHPVVRDAPTSTGDPARLGGPVPPVEHPDLARLTAREREVLAGLGRSLSNRDLAAELYVSEKTVKTHVSSVLAKLRVRDRTQAALLAVRSGVADPRR